MIRAPLLLVCAAAASAADLDLDAFPAAVVHPDGAVLSASLDLPAGRHRVRLPAWAGTVVVRGASAWHRDRDQQPAPVADAVLQPLLDERDRLVRRQQLIEAEERRLQADRTRLGVRLAWQADQAGGDPAAWQASTDAWLAGRAALLKERDAQRTAVAALLDRATAALHDRAAAQRALALDQPEPRRGVEAARLALGPATGAALRPLVVIDAPGGAAIIIEHQRPDLCWRPSAQLTVEGGRAVLVRRAEVTKPVAAELGRPRLLLSTVALDQRLGAPPERRAYLRGQELSRADSRQLASGSTGGSWLGGARSQAPAASLTMAPPPPPTESVVAEPPPASLGPQALTVDCGPQALTAGSATVGCTLGSADLALEADELAVVPALSPVAFRRLSLRLDDQVLLPGSLDLVVDGQLQAREAVAWQPPRALLTVNAGEDARVCIGDSSDWKVDPAANTAKHRRQGRDHWLFASGPAPVTVAFYATLPVSRSDRVQVQTDAATTPGFQAVEPGLLRWQVTVKPGEPQRIGLGSVIESNGGFRLE